MMSSRRRTLLLATLIVLCLGALSSGCAENLYTLPAPPPKDQWNDVSLNPADEERKSEQDYLAARATIMRLSGLIDSKRFDEALLQMSQETQAMLASASPRPDGENPSLTPLVESRVVIKGEPRAFDPAGELLAPDLSKLKDTVEGQTENETPRRKEIFALQPDESVRKIVVIKEAGQWVLHRTRLNSPSP